jgi:hypothetical protein
MFTGELNILPDAGAIRIRAAEPTELIEITVKS